jgi:FKBP-type peptidyl-prolyl cis-trans isomerase FkpA
MDELRFIAEKRLQRKTGSNSCYLACFRNGRASYAARAASDNGLFMLLISFEFHRKWAIGAAICVSFCSANLLAQTPGTSAAPTSSKMDAKVMQLQKIDVKQGTGAEAVAGKAVIVHYTGWLYDPSAKDQRGAKFDSSRDRTVPLGFILGAGKVIRGWDEGVAGMMVGGQRTLIIPADGRPSCAGCAPGGSRPPDATLISDVE